MRGFQWAAGSVPGTYHRATLKNNQDALWVDNRRDRFVAVVADGCGSGERSEVGALLGVRSLIHDLTTWPSNDLEELLILHRTRMGYRFEEMAVNAASWFDKEAREKFIHDYCLYTLVVAVMDEEQLLMYSFGDGVVGHNGEVREWDYPYNAPPYIAYDVIEPHNGLDWHRLYRGPAEDVDNFMIGTDGVTHLMNAEGKPFPGKSLESVLPVKDMWAKDSLFTNADGLRRYLSLVNEECVRLDVNGDIEKRKGLLFDDTTMVMVRRAPQ